MTPNELLAAGRLNAKVKAPYLRALLWSFETVAVPGHGTVSCTPQGLFYYDPEFVARRTVEEVAFLWIHEALHRLYKHGQRLGLRDKSRWNQAADLAINPTCQEFGLKPPSGQDEGLFPEKFGWPTGLTADAYYERLRQEEQAGNKVSMPCKGGKPGVGSGKCGSCAGNAPPGEPKRESGKSNKPGTKPGQTEAEGETTNGERSEAELDRIVKQVAREIAQAAKSRGSVPAGLARWAEGFLQPPKVPWQTVLARAVRAAVAWRPGAVDHRWDGPGRRQAGLGYGPGRPVLPRMRCPVPRVGVLVDTSGSMGQLELGAALRETGGVLAAIAAEVTVLVCDASVHGVKTVRSVREAAALLKGGGGTDMRPGIEAACRLPQRPEVLVIATDGYIGDPGPQPVGIRVVWVLIGKGAPAQPWGTQIRVED